MLVADVSWIPEAGGTYKAGISVWMPKEDDPVFVPLMPGKEVSWVFHGPRMCIGSIDERGRMVKCPEDSIILRSGTRCGPCSAVNIMDPCIRCDGRSCNAVEGRRIQCESTDYVVYMVIFNDRTLKIGVSTKRRHLTRWVEQGADYGGVLQEIEGGRQARLIENRVGRRKGATKQVRSGRKIKGLEQTLDAESAQSIADTFLDQLDDPFIGTHVELSDLSKYYTLGKLDRPPVPWRKRSDPINGRPLVGTVVGMKGSLLVTRLGSENTVIDMKQVIGYTIIPESDITVVTQTGLTDFF
ncbi:MAG: DUF2797 domain-containing protein [Candidatus Thorarchaeota archaeon]